ncbi:MAG: hypothetical protein RDU89_08380 [bacterium]|nr:hypothetical protein [bacterium]
MPASGWRLSACGRRLWKLPNVAGFGWGRRRVGGRGTGEPCIAVLVTRKVPLTALLLNERVPPRLEGCRTDVVQVGHLQLLGVDRTARLRPARPGVSVGHFRTTAGTLGAVVYARAGAEPLILSNNHVLANLADRRNRRAAPGDPILQPGPHDGGRENDTLARLLRLVPVDTLPGFSAVGERGETLTGVGPDAPRNRVDAAVARPVNRRLVNGRVLGLGRVRGVRRPRLGLRVRMSGRSSAVTRGRIQAVDVTVSVGVGDLGYALFSEQVLTTPLARPGDSGSLLLDRRNRAVGLVFAGSTDAAVANDISTVLRLLAVTLRRRPA